MRRSLIVVLCLTAIAVGIGRRFVPSRSLIGPETVLHFKLYNNVMTTGRVFDYTFNGTTGLFFDGDTPITLIPAWPGFNFDGATDFIYTSATFQSTFRNDFSMMLWVKPDDGQPAAHDYLAGCRNGAAEDEVTIQIRTTGKIRFNMESNNVVAYAEGNAATFADGAGTWTHIVAVATEDTSLRIYVNGALITLGGAPADGDATGLTFNDFTTDCNPNLGAFNSDETFDGYGNWFAGLISDYRIINKALTAIEIKNIYETTRWRFQI